MSWQALESVQDNSKVDDHTGLSIMYVIARYADATGSVGAGGRVTSPSIDTIATKSRCHRNTVLNWLPKLEATGELTIERLGSGRGSWNRYTINLPMPQESNGTSKDVPLSKDMVQDMVHNIGLMVQGAMAEMKVMVHDMVHNGTSHVVLDTNDTDKEKNIYIPPDSRQIAELKSSITKIVKTPQWEKTKDEYDAAAVLLMGWDATPESLTSFGEWWKENGWHSGLPELSTLVKEYRNFLSGIKANQGTGKVNGTFPQAAWDKVCKAVSRQVYTDLTDQEKTALKAVGLTNIRMRDSYNEPKLKTAFYEAMKQ